MSNPTPEEIVAEVRARSKAVVHAEETRDYKKAVTFFLPDAVIQPPDAPQFQDQNKLLEMYETVLAQTSEFEGTTTEIVPAASGDMAYEYGVNRFVFPTPEGPLEMFGKYLLVWRRVDGEWMVAAIAFSNNAPPPT